MSECRVQVINVTQQLNEIVTDCEKGIALVYTPHTTAALLISEDDPELRKDIIRAVECLFVNCRPFKHMRNNNPNAEAHLLSALGGTSVVLAVVNGRFDLGTYQNILLLEMDGPKQREIRCLITVDRQKILNVNNDSA